MRVLFRTNDPVLLSVTDALLRSEGILCIVLDTHTSVLEGSIDAIQRRVMVYDDDHSRARRLLQDADVIEAEPDAS